MLPTTPALRARTIGLSAAGWALLALARTAARIAVVPRPPSDVMVAFGRSLLATLPWLLATPALIALADRIGWRRGERLRALALHSAVALALSVVDAGWSFLALGWTGQPIPVGIALWYLGRLDQSLFIYLCLVAIGAGARHRRLLDAALLARARVTAQLLHARLHVLSLQLHPHFLFNTLNAVSELVHRDARAARETLASLTELLRRTLRADASQEHTLREELALLEPYLRIQRTRFHTLTVAVEAEAAALDAAIPRLLLQPLVENAIRHGTARRAGPGRIAVRARLHHQRLALEVEDDGPGPPERGLHEGIGLGNTRARLRELYGPEAGLALLPAAGRGAVARVECPLRSVPTARGREEDAPGEPALPEHLPAVRGRRVAVLVVIGWLLVALLGAQEDWLAGHLAGEPEPLLAVLGPRAGEALLWLLLTPLVLWGCGRLARARVGWAALAAAHLAGVALVASVHLGLTLWLVSPGLPENLVASILVVNVALYAALSALAHTWTIARMAAEGQADTVRLAGELAAARLDLLRWRLRPELLFRALETIGDLAATSPSRADELTGRLGELLRLLLPRGSDDEVPLGAEFEFLRAYLDVASAVGLPAPRLVTGLDPGTERAPVPGMLLQPLAELVVGERSTVVTVSATLREGLLRLAVRANGARRRTQDPGEQELRKRLERGYGRDAELTLECAGDSAAARLTIPARTAGRAVA